MEQQRFTVGGVPALLWGGPSERLYVFVHGQGGRKEEAEAFARLACAAGWQVLSVDLPQHGERQGEAAGFDPWHAVPELRAVLAWAKARWNSLALYAGSIGAWFSMLAFADQPWERCLFVSPVLDMERLICTMMGWAGVTERRLEQEKTIPTSFGQTLSWEYLLYARRHPVLRWSTPTHILYAGKDTLTDRAVVDAFVRRFGCDLTVMEDGEHWFHTPRQLEVLEQWAAGHL